MKKGSTDLLLLDVNVQLALAWPNHQFHRTACRRLESTNDRWATCAFTELGFIRVSSTPASVSAAVSPAKAAALLRQMTQDPQHTYIENHPSPLGNGWIRHFEKILGHNQVTDAYLLALAEHYNAVLVTFDRRLAALAAGSTRAEILGT